LQRTKPIVRISIISIALAILVNSLTLAIVAGFQQEIKAKIIGFNAPFFISKAGSQSMILFSFPSFSPEIIEVTQGTKIPPTFEPSASSLGLSPLGASAQDQLVKLGIVDAPATTTIVVVSNIS
jgi:hypothetical protein